MSRTHSGILSALVLLAASVLASSEVFGQDFVWAKKWGGSGDEYGYKIAVDASGAVYTVGYFSGTVDFDPGLGTANLVSSGLGDAFICKLNSAGNFVWAKKIGGPGEDWGYGVTVDAAGTTIYVVGAFQGTASAGAFNLTSAGGSDAYIAKLDGAGNFVWALGIGGTGDDADYRVALDTAGNVISAGSFSSTVDFDPGVGITSLLSAGLRDGFISKLSGAGVFMSALRVGGPGDDYVGRMVLDAANNVYTAGVFQLTADFDPGPGTTNLTSAGPAGTYDAFFSKLDSAGNLAWAKRIGGAGDDYGNGIGVDASGNVYTGGPFTGTVDFDPGAGTYNLVSEGGFDIFVSKLDSAGNFVWARRMGGTLYDNCNDLVVDSIGNVYTSGRFQDGGDFDPAPGRYGLTGQASGEAFVSALDGAGNLLWAPRSFGGSGNDVVYGMAVDPSGNVYTTGPFDGTADFDSGPGTFNLTPSGGNDAFISKIRGCGSFVDRSMYGTLLFPPLCTKDATLLGPAPYESNPVVMFVGPRDTFYLSSKGGTVFDAPLLGSPFSPLAVDDVARINGVNTSLGQPYGYQPDHPPVLLGPPIEANFVPQAEMSITLPVGKSTVLFELLDVVHDYYGHTAIYLVRDCGIWLTGANPTSINWISHEHKVSGTPPEFEVRWGVLSQLRADHNFSQVSCLGHYFNTPAADALGIPAPGDGFYYITRGLSSCVAEAYGDSGGTPDPRDALDLSSVCQ